MNRSLSRALTAFRVVLAAALLYGSLATAIHGYTDQSHDHGHFHLFLLGSVEAIGALLLLLPRVRLVGAIILVLTIAPALVVHTARGEVRPDLAVYLMGVVLVAIHEWSQRTPKEA